MPIVAMAKTPLRETSDVTLALYAQVIGLDEWLIWGVTRSGDALDGCSDCWEKKDRDWVIRYLAEAQQEIEEQVQFPLLRRWIANERRPYSYPLMTLWSQVYDAGVRATSTIQADATVTHVADDANGNPMPSTVTVTTTVTDEGEIRVYYPASLSIEGPVEIDPSDIDIAAGTATIYIPRWRLVHPNLIDQTSCLDYDTTSNFLSVVDVGRVYHDDSDEATLVWPHQDSACSCWSACCPTCSEYTHTACVYVRNSELGFVDVLPANYSSGSWSRTLASCFCNDPRHVLLNYRAGPATLSPQARDAVIRLAHSKMPEVPCACEVQQMAWERDRKVSDTLTRERINNPYGLSDGAWIAWQFAGSLRIYRGAVI